MSTIELPIDCVKLVISKALAGLNGNAALAQLTELATVSRTFATACQLTPLSLKFRIQLRHNRLIACPAELQPHPAGRSVFQQDILPG